MPKTQVAHVQNYDFGAPVSQAEVLKFSVEVGGKRSLHFEAIGDNPITVTVQVSPDGSSWSNTSAANNNTAVVSEVLPAGVWKEYQVNLRAGKDTFMRVLASGADRCQLQIRGGTAENLGIRVI
jgi:hypothetical protein